MIDEQTRALLARLADRYETAEFIVGDPSWWMHQVTGSSNPKEANGVILPQK